MTKHSRQTRKRFFRISGVVLIVAALFWLAMNLAGYSLSEETSLLRKIPVSKKLEEVLGAARERVPWGQKEDSGENPVIEPRTLSLIEVGEEAKERVVTESKEVIRGKAVEILRGLIEKLTEEKETQGEVCQEVCQEVCK